jgi:tight adherence protein C
MSPFVLALLFLSPLIAYAVSILIEENRDPLHASFLNLEFNSVNNDYALMNSRRFQGLTPLELSSILILSFLLLLVAKPGTAILLIVLLVLAYLQIKRVKVTRELNEERERIASQLPAVVELFTILISGGESISGSLRRVAERGTGELPRLIANSVELMEGGTGFSASVDLIGRESKDSSVRRFFDSLIVASQRGNSLNEVLVRQVREIRDAQKANLLKAAGRAEIALMIPIVFLILPISILFALWPSFVTLGQAMST